MTHGLNQGLGRLSKKGVNLVYTVRSGEEEEEEKEEVEAKSYCSPKSQQVVHSFHFLP